MDGKTAEKSRYGIETSTQKSWETQSRQGLKGTVSINQSLSDKDPTLQYGG